MKSTKPHSYRNFLRSLVKIWFFSWSSAASKKLLLDEIRPKRSFHREKIRQFHHCWKNKFIGSPICCIFSILCTTYTFRENIPKCFASVSNQVEYWSCNNPLLLDQKDATSLSPSPSPLASNFHGVSILFYIRRKWFDVCSKVEKRLRHQSLSLWNWSFTCLAPITNYGIFWIISWKCRGNNLGRNSRRSDFFQFKQWSHVLKKSKHSHHASEKVKS